MKKTLILSLIVLIFSALSCARQGNVIDEAYKLVEAKAPAADVANLLADSDINCQTLSSEEYVKLGMCLLYVSLQGAMDPSFATKIDTDKLEKLVTDYGEREKKLTPEQREEINNHFKKFIDK